MFLRLLKSEQKPLFLGLAYQAANANGVVEEAERNLIIGLSEELGISEDNYSKLGFEQICERLVELSSRKELIEISFEILGIMMGDTCYDDDEKAFVRRMFEIFCLSEELMLETEECLEDYLRVFRKIERITNS